MIYIIGGLPRTGKTLISSILIKQTGDLAIDTDDIRFMFNAKAHSPISFASGAKITRVTESLAPYIDSLVKASLHDTHDHIICGEALSPAAVAKFKDSCKICFLGFSDGVAQLKRVKAHQHADDWTKNLEDAHLQHTFKQYQQRSKQLQAECAEHGIDYFDMGADEFLPTVGKIIESLTGKKLRPSLVAKAAQQYMQPAK